MSTDLGSPQEINYQGRRTDFQSVHQPRTDWKSVLRVDHFLPNALVDERLESLERQVEDLRRELHAAVLSGKPKSHIVDRVFGAIQDRPEWDEVIRLGRE